MTTDLEGAVERVKAVAGLPHTTPVRASVLVCQEDLRTILDALASITRERDAIRAEADETNGLLEEMRRQLTITQDERDALLEGLRPFAALAEYYRIGGPLRARTGPVMAVTDHRIGERELTVEHLFRAAALVNGEVG